MPITTSNDRIEDSGRFELLVSCDKRIGKGNNPFKNFIESFQINPNWFIGVWFGINYYRVFHINRFFHNKLFYHDWVLVYH